MKRKQRRQIKKNNSVQSLDTSPKSDQSPELGLKGQKSPRIILSKTKAPETMEELLAEVEDDQFGLKRGNIVEGTIISISPKEVLVDIGKKSFGIVSNWELEQVKDYVRMLKTGDRVVAQVNSPENDSGYAVLSLRKSSSERRWKILSEKKETGEDIEVLGLEMAKGGLLVEWQNLRGFIPATQIDIASNNPSIYVGRRLKVRVLEIDPSINRLVLSQKAAVLGISPEIMRKKLEKIKSNERLHGVISGIAPFGLFVNIDGLEGLVHISEIAWEKVENPANFYKIGEKVEVVVLDVNQEERKLNLSIKRLMPDPWKNILDRFPIDSIVTGKIVRLAPYGAFVQLETGIEGLIHISKIPTNLGPTIGQKIECIVEKVDPVKRKISLTLIPKGKPIGYK